MIDAQARHCYDQRAAAVRSLVQSDNGPCFIETASHHPFFKSGYKSVRIDGGGGGDQTNYVHREEIMDGKVYDSRERRWFKTGKRRSSMIIIACHEDDDFDKQIDEAHRTTFVCSRQIDGTHIIMPIYIGRPFWAPDKSDADVASIVAECRHKNEQRNSGSPAKS